MASVRMPFGRHRGAYLEDLPESYLIWLLGRTLREPLHSAVRAEAQRRREDEEDTHRDYRERHQREYQYHQPRPPRGPSPALTDVDEIISTGRRVLATKYHPDRGGNLPKMQAINACADWLLQRAKELLP